MSRGRRGWTKILKRKSAPPRADRKTLLGRSLRPEPLEMRALMAGTPIPVQFTIPSDLVPKGVYAEMSAQLTAPYTNSKGAVLPSGAWVYYKASIGDYALATTQTTDFVFSLTGTSPTVNLPNTLANYGQIVIGVGSKPIITYSAAGVAPPTSATNPTNIFGLFEYAVASVAGVNQLDIDMSEIDQVGVPFTVTTSPTPPTPADQGIGINVQRGDMFNLYTPYITSQGATAALFQQSLTAGLPYRIIAPQNILEQNPAPTLNGLTAKDYKLGGSLTIGQNYYYWVTATDASGQSAVNNYTVAVPYNNSILGHNYPMQTVKLSWTPFTGPAGYTPTGYNVYRNRVNDPTTAGLIGSTSGTTFKDNGLARIGGAPPTSSYTYNPLNAYFNTAIGQFFANYVNNEFKIDCDGYTFTGNTNVSYNPNGGSYTYCALVLTSADVAGTYVIYQPFFNSNTNLDGAPPPPPGLPHPDQSPAAMILACDGVFNTGSAVATTISDLENKIVSAFNRGIANNFAIRPDNWANTPSLNSATATYTPNLAPTDGVSPGTYYYVVTATNMLGQTPQSTGSSETTASLERMVTVGAGQNTVQLSWTSQDSPTQYNIYRSQTQGSGYQLVGTIANAIGNIATGYNDTTRTPTAQSPVTYYAPGSTANWYAGFLHTNYTNNPASGVSINGLAYGYPYDDQGNDSTNFQATFTNVYVTLQSWGTTSLQSSGPASIQITSQPTSGYLGSSSSITFKVLDAQGAPYLGGVAVAINLLGAQSGTFSVTTDSASGIGKLTLSNSRVGTTALVLRLDNGVTVQSDAYQVVSLALPSQLQSLYR